MAKIEDPTLLTYIVDGTPTNEHLRFNTTTKKIRLVASGALIAKNGVKGQCLFSKIKQVLRASSILIGKFVPVKEMIHDESMELVNGWQFEDEDTLKMIRDCGVAYVNSAGVPTNMFACFYTNGMILSGAPYGTLSNATNASTFSFMHVNLNASFGVNELIEIYRDTNGDGSVDFDYRNYAKLFLREGGYTYSEQSNSEIGYPVLTYKKYVFALTHAVDAVINGVTALADGILDGAGYASMSIAWFDAAQNASLGTNGPYPSHVVITSDNHTHIETYAWVQRQLRKTSDIDATAGAPHDRTGAVTPALVFMDGETLKTKFQPGVGGVHIAGIAASSYNYVLEADDNYVTATDYRGYPYTAALTCEFDDYLVADTGPAKFWVFTEASYGGASPTLVKNASDVDITGNVTGASMPFSYAWAVDTPIVGIAIGTDGAKIAIARTTLTRSVANKLVFVAGQERWYADPA